MLITTGNQTLTMPTNQEQFHDALKALTQPLNGQYPRPWMTELADPLCDRSYRRTQPEDVLRRNLADSRPASRRAL